MSANDGIEGKKAVNTQTTTNTTATTKNNNNNYSIFQNSYLKSYPYLFVRESDQTDYLCTLCDGYLREEELQSHLFQGHRAESVKEFFVKVQSHCSHGSPQTSLLFRSSGNKSGQSLYICVVCWAKINSAHETVIHRRSCKPELAGMESSHHLAKRSKLEQPEILFERLNNSKKNRKMMNNGHDQHYFNHSTFFNNNNYGDNLGLAESCQCSLCSHIIPVQGLSLHLKEHHRITCALDQINCPLCVTGCDIMELGVHLTTVHGLVPPTAVNAVLFWVMSSTAVSLNEKTVPKNVRLSASSSAASTILNVPNLVSSVSTSGSKLGNLLNASKHNELPKEPSLHSGHIPTVLQSLLNKNASANSDPTYSNALTVVSKFTTRHVTGAEGKESVHCLVCGKWFAIPPVKHLRGHMIAFKEEKRRLVGLINQTQVCIICYEVFENLDEANHHLLLAHDINTDMAAFRENNDNNNAYLRMPHEGSSHDEIPTVVEANSRGGSPISSSKSAKMKGTKVELDNAGRVKSGKVRKQCELCGEWSNIKWFFKHMSEVHKALFCRCCREYLPVHEHEEHKKWHAEPPYMGQKIRIENGQPVVIDRKERASLTPIGSLAPWGGSSGGKVVKAVDSGYIPTTPKVRKRKTQQASGVSSPKSSSYTSPSQTSGLSLVGHLEVGEQSKMSPIKDTLMPKEICPVCGIHITYKNLARHIKLRHKIKDNGNEMVIDGPVPEMSEDISTDYAGSESANDLIDPTDFLDDSSPIALEEDEQEESRESFSIDSRVEKDDSTSDNKMESMLKTDASYEEPSRTCKMCDQSVSPLNFKQHLVTLHPEKYAEYEKKYPDDEEFQNAALSDLTYGNGGAEEEGDGVCEANGSEKNGEEEDASSVEMVVDTNREAEPDKEEKLESGNDHEERRSEDTNDEKENEENDVREEMNWEEENNSIEKENTAEESKSDDQPKVAVRELRDRTVTIGKPSDDQNAQGTDLHPKEDHPQKSRRKDRATKRILS